MKLNSNTKLTLSSTPASLSHLPLFTQSTANDPIALVPYMGAHVATYHGWMQRSELLSLTASERLATVEEERASMEAWRADESKLTFIIVTGEDQQMVGDVNICFLDVEQQEAEVDVMVAEPAFRRKGFAHVALAMAMSYAMKQFPTLSTFVAKIIERNAPSIALFEKRLRFKFAKHVVAFGEVHYELPANEFTSSAVGLDVARTLEIGPFKQQ